MSGVSLVTYNAATKRARDALIAAIFSTYKVGELPPGVTRKQIKADWLAMAANDVDWLLKCVAREIFLQVHHELLPDSHAHPNPEIRALISQQRRKLNIIRAKYLDM